MNERQEDAIVAACQAHGAIQSTMGAYKEADRLVRLAMIYAEQVPGIAVYARRVYDLVDQALARSGAALQATCDEIGDLIVELKRNHQPPEPLDFSS